MAGLKATDFALALGRVRWAGANPTLMGRAISVSSKLQVQVQSGVSGTSISGVDSVWLDAIVLSIAPDQIMLRTSFARFIAEPELACRWPLDAPPLSRRELELVFADSVADVSDQMAVLVERFRDDPQLTKSPFEQLLAYSAAMHECAGTVQSIARLIESVAQDLTARSNRSKLVVAQG